MFCKQGFFSGGSSPPCSKKFLGENIMIPSFGLLVDLAICIGGFTFGWNLFAPTANMWDSATETKAYKYVTSLFKNKEVE